MDLTKIKSGKDVAKGLVNAFIEIPLGSDIKYELDKEQGVMVADRFMFTAFRFPFNYGFIPQTYCSKNIAELCRERTGRDYVVGDDDPLDICVLTEKVISHGDIIVRAIPIGGFRMIDQGQADDKIIAVMQGDGLYSAWQNIEDCPRAFIDRLKHYFLTYKDLPGSEERICEITHVYGREEAMEVIRRSREDYKERFGKLEDMLASTLDD